MMAAKERSNEEQLDYIPQNIIVEFYSSVEDETIYEIINAIADGGQIITGMYGVDESLEDSEKEQIEQLYDDMKTKIVSVRLAKNQTTEKCIKEFESMDVVKSISRNGFDEPCGSSLTNDTYVDKQWYLNKINVSDGWTAIKNANKCGQIKVAVIDSGVKLSHSDMKGRYDEANCVDVTGSKAVRLSTLPVSQQDLSGHGTMVSSIVAAKTNNNTGVAGVCGVDNSDNGFSCRIMGIKVVIYRNPGDNYLSYTLENELKAMDYAMSHGADIINLSFSGAQHYPSLQTVIESAREKGIMVIAAAGNEGKSDAAYPSDYKYVTSVIGLYSNNEKTAISNYGNNKDIAAPGHYIFACDGGSKEYYANPKGGTSYAAPMVSAAAAMIKAVDKDLTPAEIETIIKSTATDIGKEGYDDYTANGLLNVGLAVQRAVYRSYYDKKPVIQDVSMPSSGKVKLKWESVYNEEDMLIYRSTSKDGTYSRVGKVEIKKPGTYSFTDTGLESGTVYYYKIRCRSAYGDSFKYGIYSNKVSAKAS